MRARTAALVFIVLFFPSLVLAQYWDNRVLEKSFEQTDFFFMPSNLNPYGIGSFRTVNAGFLRDPLVNVIANPARLALDTLQDHYLYTDFRGTREMKERDYYPPWAILAADIRPAVFAYPYPRFYITARRELEPVFSGAYIGRLLPSLAPGLFAGVTYQLVSQDEKYYDIPQDVYRIAGGYDYNGARVAAGGNIPIVDKYSGKDEMHQSGHFLTGYLRYAFPTGLDLGIKASRVWFGREGSFGSSNLWDYARYNYYTSFWSNLEARDQTYDHWDIAAGAEFPITERIRVGAMGGYLRGDATQALGHGDSSYFAYEQTLNSSFYRRSGNILQEWRHAGRTTYFGGDITSQLSATSTFSLFYQHRKTAVDIGLASSILDTSFSTYTWDNNGTRQTTTSRSYLQDQRAGSGTQHVTTDRLTAAFQWDATPRVYVSIGLQLEWQKAVTRTTESVLESNRYSYMTTGGQWDNSDRSDESKDLLWDFTAKRTTFQVPFFVTIKSSDKVELLFGLNRTMAEWRIDDVTLALIRYRNQVYNGTPKHEENFGERYTEPTEKQSNVQTSFIAGLSVAPVSPVKIRLLMVPVFADSPDGSELQQFQWWLSVTLTPF